MKYGHVPIRIYPSENLTALTTYCPSFKQRARGINESANFRFLQRLSVLFGSRRECPSSLASCRDCRPPKMASCRDCPCDSTSCRESRQEAISHGESLQETLYRAQQSRQEARDHGQSRRKPNTTDRLCRKRKLANSFVPCGESLA